MRSCVQGLDLKAFSCLRWLMDETFRASLSTTDTMEHQGFVLCSFGRSFSTLRFRTNLSILLVRWRTLQVEWEVPGVCKTLYRSKCALNRAKKISAASEVEISSEARCYWTGDRIANNSASMISQSMVESVNSPQVARGDSALPSRNPQFCFYYYFSCTICFCSGSEWSDWFLVNFLL